MASSHFKIPTLIQVKDYVRPSSKAMSVQTEEGWFSPDPSADLYTKTWMVSSTYHDCLHHSVYGICLLLDFYTLPYQTLIKASSDSGCSLHQGPILELAFALCTAFLTIAMLITISFLRWLHVELPYTPLTNEDGAALPPKSSNVDFLAQLIPCLLI
jgi:hypothetical protein